MTLLVKNNQYLYTVAKLDTHLPIDGKWDKTAWKYIKSVEILNDNNWETSFKPQTEVKLCYDDLHLYVIFRVQDQYVKCVHSKHNGPVWQDSCVEFFFAPNPDNIQNYFNFEVNCSGYVYFAYQRVSRTEFDLIAVEDIRSINVAHTIDGPIHQELKQAKEWIVEYKLPFELLAKYTELSPPSKGDRWRINFYKCTENNTHPHWLSWAPIINSQPDFHLPRYFGTLIFS